LVYTISAKAVVAMAIALRTPHWHWQKLGRCAGYTQARQRAVQNVLTDLAMAIKRLKPMALTKAMGLKLLDFDGKS
jgi:hypothetical protein